MENLPQKKNLTLLWVAQAISQAGDAIYQLALLWLVLDLTNSPIITGLIAMSAYLPALIFGLFAGVFSDRMNRFRLIIIANAGQALTVLLIPLFLWHGHSNVWVICGLAFLRSCFNTFFQPALQSFIPMMFPEDRLVKINAILATSGQIAWMMGPFFAGVLLTIVSLPNLFLVDAGSFLLAIGFLFLIHQPLHPKQPEEHSHWDELKRGLSYLFQKKPIFWMIIITFINNLFIMGPAIVGLPILVKIALGGTASDFAFVEGCMAAGALVGSFIVSKLHGILKNGTIWAIGLFLDGITYSFLFWVQSVEMAMVMIFLHGIGIPLIMVSRTSIVQIHTPNKFHGRLFSMVHLGVVGTTAISSGLVGVISSIISIKLLFFGIGCGAALCGVIGLTVPSLRNIR
jgi:MFS family permease